MCVVAGIAGAAVVGAGATIYASHQASNAQTDASNRSIRTQTDMYNQTRADQTPWRVAGANAVNALQGYYGLGGNSVPGVSGFGDPSSGLVPTANGGIQRQIPGGGAQPMDYNSIIQNLPGYQFNFDQGETAVQRNLAARGLLQSGAGVKALTQYGQGYASQATQDYLNGLRSLAGLGEVSSQATGAAGQNAANNISQSQLYAGNATASSYVNAANAVNNGLNNAVGLYGLYQGQGLTGYGGGGSIAETSIPGVVQSGGYYYNLPEP